MVHYDCVMQHFGEPTSRARAPQSEYTGMDTQVLTLNNGLRCAYASSGNGPPIILLHGWGQSRRTWERIMPLLAARYTVYALDLPGFGESETPHATLTLPDYAAFVSDFAQQRSIIPYAIIGHSFGGRVAVQYAAAHDIDKLVLCGVADPLRRSAAQWLHAWCVAWIGRLAPRFVYNIERTWFTPSGYADTAPATAGRARRMLDTYHATHAMRDLPFDRLSARVLCIYGTRDWITPHVRAASIRSRIPQAELSLVDGGDHFTHIRKHALFAKRVLEFLDSEIRETRIQPERRITERRKDVEQKSSD